MRIDDDLPAKPQPFDMAQDLASLSIHELEERVLFLQNEISRCQATIAAKRDSLNAASTFFKPATS